MWYNGITPVVQGIQWNNPRCPRYSIARLIKSEFSMYQFIYLSIFLFHSCIILVNSFFHSLFLSVSLSLTNKHTHILSLIHSIKLAKVISIIHWIIYWTILSCTFHTSIWYSLSLFLSLPLSLSLSLCLSLSLPLSLRVCAQYKPSPPQWPVDIPHITKTTF